MMKEQTPDIPQFGPKRENNKESMRSRAKRVVGGFLLAAAGIGLPVAAGEAISHQEAKHNQEMNKVFEPILKPAAEDIAQAAVDKYNQFKKEKWTSDKGYAFDSKSTLDPSKYDLSVTQNDGDFTHTFNVTLGKDEKGNFDSSTVISAEKSDILGGKHSSVTRIVAEDGEHKYWTASTASAADEYSAGYDTANDDIDSARKIAKSVEKSLSK